MCSGQSPRPDLFGVKARRNTVGCSLVSVKCPDETVTQVVDVTEIGEIRRIPCWGCGTGNSGPRELMREQF
jgi:Pyruvate/2-oxoacid:ferredoxin oxidoreductase delta subunit